MIDLPPCVMLYFKGIPYKNEDDFRVAIEIAAEAMEAYDTAPFGWEFALELAPRFNFGSSAAGGAKLATPVKDA